MNFPVDLKKFKKISSDHNSTVLQHPMGHKITVAHKALGEDMRKQLHDIPHMYSGGEMSSETPQMPFNININPSPLMSPSPQIPGQVAQVAQDSGNEALYKKYLEMNSGVQDFPGAPKGAAEEGALKAVEAKNNLDRYKQDRAVKENENEQAKKENMAERYSTLGITPPEGIPHAIPQEMPKAPQQPEGSPQAPEEDLLAQQQAALMGGYQEQKAGLMQEALGQSQLGRAQAETENQAAAQSKTLMDNFTQSQKELSDHRLMLQQALASGQIDPNRYINNMGTPGKIGTAIGLLLGGVGGALTHQENPALKVITAQIDRDIDAQRTNLGKTQSLLDANYKDMGNLRDAMSMTKIMQTDMVSHQLKAEADKAQDPLAKAALLKNAGILDTQMGQAATALNVKRAIYKSMQSGSTENIGPQLNMLRIVDPKQAEELSKRYVPGVGIGTSDVPDKTRMEMASRQDVDNKLQRLIKFSEQNSGSLDPATTAKGQTMARDLQDAIRQANGQGVFREAEKEFMNSIVVDDPTQFFAKFRSQPRYKQAREDNMSSLNAMKKAYGLPVREKMTLGAPVLNGR